MKKNNTFLLVIIITSMYASLIHAQSSYSYNESYFENNNSITSEIRHFRGGDGLLEALEVNGLIKVSGGMNGVSGWVYARKLYGEIANTTEEEPIIITELQSQQYSNRRTEEFQIKENTTETEKFQFTEEITTSQFLDFLINAGYAFKESFIEDGYFNPSHLTSDDINLSGIVLNIETGDIILQYGDVYHKTQSQQFFKLLDPNIDEPFPDHEDIRWNLFEKVEFYKSIYKEILPDIQAGIRERNNAFKENPRNMPVIQPYGNWLDMEYEVLYYIDTYNFLHFSNVEFVENLSKLENFHHFANSIAGDFYSRTGIWGNSEEYSYKSFVFAGVYPAQNPEYIFIWQADYVDSQNELAP